LIVSRCVVYLIVGQEDDHRVEPDRSACRDGQADDGIIADWGDPFQGNASSALGPLVILFEQDGTDEAGNGG
jgi:hypothetical protein